MSRIRLAAIAATIACGLMLVGGTGIASAQDRTGAHSRRSCRSPAPKGGKKFKGTYTIERFVSKGGKLYSVGTLKGKVGPRRSPRRTSGCPRRVANASAAGEGQPGPAAPAAAAAGR